MTGVADIVCWHLRTVGCISQTAYVVAWLFNISGVCCSPSPCANWASLLKLLPVLAMLNADRHIARMQRTATFSNAEFAWSDGHLTVA